jgi:hypothetical protein
MSSAKQAGIYPLFPNKNMPGIYRLSLATIDVLLFHPLNIKRSLREMDGKVGFFTASILLSSIQAH